MRARRRRDAHAIYLIPGFFGFTNLGRFRYFMHVDRFLRGRGEIVHLIGHSTGGVDARLLVAPGVVLPTKLDVDRWAGRVRSVIGVSSPQHGTPLAAYLTTRRGQRTLALLSLTTSYVLREVFEDQSLLLQLTLESMDLFAATVRDRPGVRYGSVVTRSRPPGVGSALAAGLDAGAQAIHAIYGAIYRLTAQSRAAETPQPDAAQRRALRRAYGKVPGAHANDGIVPTRAQVHGQVIAAVRGDHLDVIGHFNDPAADPPHFDWLTTGSGFDRARFEAVWDGVLGFLLAERRQRSGRPST